MRAGLPKAQYLAFTRTPLLGRERKTNAWFDDYVSEYNFQQSMDDGATVPLFYEKRGIQPGLMPSPVPRLTLLVRTDRFHHRVHSRGRYVRGRSDYRGADADRRRCHARGGARNRRHRTAIYA